MAIANWNANFFSNYNKDIMSKIKMAQVENLPQIKQLLEENRKLAITNSIKLEFATRRVPLAEGTCHQTVQLVGGRFDSPEIIEVRRNGVAVSEEDGWGHTYFAYETGYYNFQFTSRYYFEFYEELSVQFAYKQNAYYYLNAYGIGLAIL